MFCAELLHRLALERLDTLRREFVVQRLLGKRTQRMNRWVVDFKPEPVWVGSHPKGPLQTLE